MDWRLTTINALRFLKLLSRSRLAFIQSVVLPTVMVLVFLATFGRMLAGSAATYSQRATPLIAVYGSAIGATSLARVVYLDRMTGLLDRLRLSPVPRATYTAGAIFADGIRSVVSTAFVVAVAHLAGFRFERGVLAALGFFMLVLFLGTVWANLAVYVGLRAQTHDAIPLVMNGLVPSFLFLSTGLVPPEFVASDVQPLVRLNPISRVVDALMSLSSAGSSTARVFEALILILLFSLVLQLAILRLCVRIGWQS